jgi:hypothetical protein
MLSLNLPTSFAADTPREQFLKILDPLVDKALAGYNSEDPVKFFKYFAKALKHTTTRQYFHAVYMGTYKKDLGGYKSRVLIESKCSFDQYYPMLVYEGVFDNYKRVIITVTFMNEYGFYRITQISFDKIHD